MRDANKLKERVELHLDRRQVTSIALVSLLLLGSVFALGVMVGKNLAPVARSATPVGSILDRLDARGAGTSNVLDAGAPDGLTFQEELTKRAPPERPTAPIVRAPAPKPEAKAERTPTAPEVAVASGPAVRRSNAGADAGSESAAEPEDAPEVVINESHKEPVRPQTVPLPKDGVSEGASASFAVQVKATQSSDEAEKFAAKLRSKGYHATVAEADVPGKGRWYRVRVGRFDTRAQAEHYLDDFERETHLAAFVTTGSH
jgi:cell division septation protein DedD